MPGKESPVTTLEKVCIGAKLVCEVCGKTRWLNPDRVKDYIWRLGWPECCGQTMRLVTASEQAATQAGEVKQDER